MKQSKCHECKALNGQHFNQCTTRGYSAVGPHPDAPAREPDAPARDPNAPVEMCCGGTTVRAVCVYHGGTSAAPTERAPAYEVEDLLLGGARVGDALAPADLIYATPTGGVVGVAQ